MQLGVRQQPARARAAAADGVRSTGASNGWRLRLHAGPSPPGVPLSDGLPAARPSRPCLPESAASSSLHDHDGLLNPTPPVSNTCSTSAQPAPPHNAHTTRKFAADRRAQRNGSAPNFGVGRASQGREDARAEAGVGAVRSRRPTRTSRSAGSRPRAGPGRRRRRRADTAGRGAAGPARPRGRRRGSTRGRRRRRSARRTRDLEARLLPALPQGRHPRASRRDR